MNSETLEILFYFLTISMPATFFVSKSFHNLTSSYFFLARSDTLNLVYYVHTVCDTWPAATSVNLSTTTTSPQQATTMVKCYT